MQDSGIPVKIPLPFGQSAGANYIRTIPTPSQIGITNGAASFTDGFPPLCFEQPGVGGAGPWGSDFNGILNQITGGLQWLQAGAPLYYDSAFATAIGGYPKGAIVTSMTLGWLWQSLVDNNTTNPDTGGANWTLLFPQRLVAPVTVYVNASTGSDTNAGTSGAPWQTFARAIQYINQINTNGFAVTVNCTGNFTTGLSVGASFAGGGGVTFAFPSGSSIAVSSGNAIHGINGAVFTVSGPVALSSSDNTSGTAAGHAIYSQAQAVIGVTGGPSFGVCAQAQLFTGDVGFLGVNGNYTITGGATAHASVGSGRIDIGNAGNAMTVSLSGTPTFSTAFATVTDASNLFCPSNIVSFSGSANGPKYSGAGNGVFDTSGGGANFFPGSVAGSLVTGAQLI